MTTTDAQQPFTIVPVRTSTDLEEICSLFLAYAKWLNLDLSFQSFAEELSTLPGKYSPNNGGELFLARLSSSETPVGCVALRRLQLPAHFAHRPDNEPACEIKRLYTVPDARGLGMGRTLLAATIEAARKNGYRSIWLDSLMPMMQKAVSLYEALGFERSEKYYETQLEGTVFFRLRLGSKV